MNVNEARLALAEEITNILMDLTDESETGSPAEIAELRDAMGDATDIIMEALQVEVLSVDGDVLTVSMNLGELPE